MTSRASGILLPVSSLPSPYGIGDFGPEAYRFVDFLHSAGQKRWQILPLTIPDNTGSPYASPSAFAGNWMLISPEFLLQAKLIERLPARQKVGPIQHSRAWVQKTKMLHESFAFFHRHSLTEQRKRFAIFKQRERSWLNDYALFMALKDWFFGKQWYKWPTPLAKRQPAALKRWTRKLKNQIHYSMYCQWIFFEQWQNLKRYANKRDIQIIGDLPFFLTNDSVDVWKNQQLFLLMSEGKPRYISGVPPDYFSKQGQLWNDPQYNWRSLQTSSFRWWVGRIRKAMELYDFIRLDHFRGFRAVWFIKRGSKTAKKGQWVSVPSQALFKTLRRKLGNLPFIAEDLGVITNDVNILRKQLGFPGMRVLQFAFSGDPNNYHLPEKMSLNSIAYTGTHDNDTARGWIEGSGKPHQRRNALAYAKATKKNFAWKLIEIGMRSRPHTFIAPMQDVLNLGSEARINKPSTTRGNWSWRLQPNVLKSNLAKRLKRLTREAKR